MAETIGTLLLGALGLGAVELGMTAAGFSIFATVVGSVPLTSESMGFSILILQRAEHDRYQRF